MNRFASGLGGIKKAAGKAEQPKAIEPRIEEVVERVGALAESAGQPPSRQGKVAISAYFDPAVRKQLAILAVKEDRSQAALLAEALNLLFVQHGEPPIARA